jgi:outer membrane protein assembly factor BamB
VIDGVVKWRHTTKGLIKSSPLVYDNKLYFGSFDKYFYCLDPETGNLIWKQNINGLIECSPVVDNTKGASNITSSISGNSIY